ncbi:Carboxylesterase family-domain-containing protein [Cryomyces antarcticus]
MMNRSALINTTLDFASEDCLFLNVYAPANASNLPVLVWIHGGGYGAGNGREDLTAIIKANNNSFVSVAIQYRLGAFGFLSSDEVYRNGVVNAGLLDQHFALQWVQAYSVGITLHRCSRCKCYIYMDPVTFTFT